MGAGEHGHGEHAAIEVRGAPLEVVSVVGREALSELFRYDVLCAGGETPAAAWVGEEAVLTLRDGFGGEQRVRGVIAEATTRASDDDAALRLVLRPHAFRWTLGRDSRVFQEMSIPDVAREVLADLPATRWALAEPHPVHPYCAQYREDDWTFVARLLEEEGIYYTFDHDDDATTLVFADRSGSAPDLEGGAELAYVSASGAAAAREHVDELGESVAVAPTRFTVGSFDPGRPSFKVEASAGEGPFEHYDAPGGGPEDVEVCAVRARVHHEAAAASRAVVEGRATSVRLAPGRVVAIVGHPVRRLEGRFLVTAVETTVTQRRRGAGEVSGRAFTRRFRAIPRDVPFRAPLRTPVSLQAGLQSGRVVGPPGEAVWPDEAGRVRVELRWDRRGGGDARAGKWMRVAQRGTAGSVLLPRVGWSVLTTNDEGSVDAPSVLSRLHDAEHPPAYTLPTERTRVVWRTATVPGDGSFNEITFEDRTGAEEMIVSASRDLRVFVRNDKTDQVTRDARRTIGVDHSLTVAKGASERVARHQTIAIGADDALRVGADRVKTVDGGEREVVGGGRELKTGTAHEATITGTRRLSVGTVLADTTLGPIAASAGRTTTVLVGGARVVVAARSIREQVALVALQVVGGAKVELAKRSRVTHAKRGVTETVAGVVMRKTAGALAEGAALAASYAAGGALAATAPAVVVEATKQIVLESGGSRLTIEPSVITLRAPRLTLSGESLVLDTALVEHNG
jgi:type VI secretion system secreted protein VgrG